MLVTWQAVHMAGDKRFEVLITYDASIDVATMSFKNVVVATPEDANRIRDLAVPQLVAIGKKVDLLIDLHDFVVKPSGMRAYGEMRAKLLADHTASSFRYGGDAQTKSSVFTTAVLDGTSGNVAATREEALRALLVARQKRLSGGPPVQPPSEPIRPSRRG